MRWLLDQGLPRLAAFLLREKGMDVIHVGEVGLAHAKDLEILTRAEKEDRIVVTLDSDFHAMLAATGACRPSVIRIREEGMRGQALADLILRLSQQFSDALNKGCVLTVTLKQARLRMLPINP
ncbi:MAG: DUF5615 family PIN-like protein [Luteolibacter sp.]